MKSKEEIIRAFKCHMDDASVCIECPYNKTGDKCLDYLMQDAIELLEGNESEDVVNHPSHYTREGAMETIEEMVLVFGKEATAHYCLLNVWKYRARAISKNQMEDMQKSDWYMNKYKELIGVRVQIPEGYYGKIEARSGHYKNRGIITTGVIDSGYTGEIGVTLLNTSDVMQIFERGDKIAQMVIQKHESPELVVVGSFPETERGNGGFGSTGV